MSLVFDCRSTLGSRPAVHALVVGVGEYADRSWYLPPAVASASAIATWLQKHSLAEPLATCRVLFSPSTDLAGSGPTALATIDNFLRSASEWRADAASHRDNIALFYFSGHGFQRSTQEDLMLFSDFGNSLGPALRGSVSVDNIFRGLAPRPDAPEIARTQLYFIDTSRTVVSNERYQLSRPTMVFDEFSSNPDDRSAIIFYATGPGQNAWARPDHVSVFTEALLRCLDGEAAVPLDNSFQRWGVTVNSLIQGLHRVMSDASKGLPHTQTAVVGGLVRDREIRHMDSPPITDLVVSVANATMPGKVSLQDPSGRVVDTRDLAPSNTVHFQAKSGLYFIKAETFEGTLLASTVANVQPGFAKVDLSV